MIGKADAKKQTEARRRGKYDVPSSERVLVAIINTARDLRIAQEERWYRIPVQSAPRNMDFRYIAFYQTKIFKAEGWAIRYWAEVKRRSIITRLDLLPDQPHHPRAQEQYYKLELGAVNVREPAIISRRGRRIVFIPTTLAKFHRAAEINDLFHESPLEDRLWEEFKTEHIEAERQYYLTAKRKNYCLDFALFCENGKVNVECDGDRWHIDAERAPEDNERNNALASEGWTVLRFNGYQLENEMPQCIQRVRETANRYGGLVTPEGELRYYAQGNDRSQQLNLFQETEAEYNAKAKSENAPLPPPGAHPTGKGGGGGVGGGGQE